MHMTIENAAATLAVPLNLLAQRMRRKQKIVVKDGVPYVLIRDAAAEVGLPEVILDAVIAGKEWLLTDFEIRNLYNIGPKDVKNIAGPPLYTVGSNAVYQLTPFIDFLKSDPRERAQTLEG